MQAHCNLPRTCRDAAKFKDPRWPWSDASEKLNLIPRKAKPCLESKQRDITYINSMLQIWRTFDRSMPCSIQLYTIFECLRPQSPVFTRKPLSSFFRELYVAWNISWRVEEQIKSKLTKITESNTWQQKKRDKKQKEISVVLCTLFSFETALSAFCVKDLYSLLN